MLARQNMLGFPAVSVAEVCLVDMTVMQAEALLGEPDGPFEHEPRGCKAGNKIAYL